MTRRTARAPIGERACGEAPVNWKRLTVLGALGLDGVVTMTTVTTGTTIPVFVDFLQTSLLPVLREQKPDAILVMDNLSAHKSQAVKDAIRETAAGLKPGQQGGMRRRHGDGGHTQARGGVDNGGAAEPVHRAV